MAINTNYQYPTDWYNTEDFPSQSNDEQQIRGMMQEMPNLIRDALNDLAANIRSEYIHFNTDGTIPEGTVQSAVEYVMAQVNQAWSGVLTTDSVETGMIQNGAVTSAKLAPEDPTDPTAEKAVATVNIQDGAVTEDQLGYHAVTADKIGQNAVTGYAILNGEVNEDKLASTVQNYYAKYDIYDGGTYKKVPASAISMRKVSVSANYTLSLSDAGKALYCTNSSDITITIPAKTAVDFPIDTEILVIRAGDGKVTFLKGNDTVSFLNSGEPSNWSVPRTGTGVLLKKMTSLSNGSTTWWLNGTPIWTGSIADKAITKAKLAQAVQDAIDAAYVKPVTGIPKANLASDVQTSLGKADSAYQKADTGIPKTDLASAVQTSLGKADTAYQQPSGGIPSSDMAAQSKILLTSAMYGTTLPTSPAPVTGQLFFKKV